MDTDPANQGHSRLKEREYSRHTAHAVFFHVRLVESVGEGNRKSVHSQTYAQQNTLKKESKTEFHKYLPIKNHGKDAMAYFLLLYHRSYLLSRGKMATIGLGAAPTGKAEHPLGERLSSQP